MDAFEKLSTNGIKISQADILEVVNKYKIKELSVFGSSIRKDFTPDSDIDLLIEFSDSSQISLFDLLDIQDYFEKLTKRPVDVVEPAGLKNPYRRESILKSKEILYVA
jgi:predicted nucleotidyltransferase